MNKIVKLKQLPLVEYNVKAELLQKILNVVSIICHAILFMFLLHIIIIKRKDIGHFLRQVCKCLRVKCCKKRSNRSNSVDQLGQVPPGEATQNLDQLSNDKPFMDVLVASAPNEFQCHIQNHKSPKPPRKMARTEPKIYPDLTSVSYDKKGKAPASEENE